MWAWVIELMIVLVKIGLSYKSVCNLRLVKNFYI